MLSLEVYDVVLSGIFFFSKNSVKSVFLTIKSCCGAERANCDVVVLFCRVKTIFALFIESFSWFLYMSLIGRIASVNIAAGDLMNVQSVFLRSGVRFWLLKLLHCMTSFVAAMRLMPISLL